METLTRVAWAVTALVLALTFKLPEIAAATSNEVIIDTTGLRPPVLETQVRQRVTFVNRTGKPVHLEFRHAPERHEVFQVPGQIWATFFVPGRHPYVVHVVEGTAERPIEGAVDVADDPHRQEGPPVCDGTTLSTQGRPEVCIER